jgi:hypothetical protein
MPAPLPGPRVPPGLPFCPRVGGTTARYSETSGVTANPSGLVAPLPPQRSWLSSRDLRWSDHPWNRGWRSNRHLRQSDRSTLCDSFVTCFDDFSCAPHGTDDSTYATRGPGIPALLTSPSGHVGATGITSTSVIAAGEGHTVGGSSGQPSYDDHAGEAGLPSTDRQTHTVSHLVVVALSGAHLRPRRPHRPVLAPCHGRRI